MYVFSLGVEVINCINGQRKSIYKNSSQMCIGMYVYCGIVLGNSNSTHAIFFHFILGLLEIGNKIEYFYIIFVIFLINFVQYFKVLNGIN